MNISVYLPHSLMDRFQSYIKSKGTTKNAAIREAVELLLREDKNASWGSWIDDFTGDPSLESFESYRSELKEPNQKIF